MATQSVDYELPLGGRKAFAKRLVALGIRDYRGRPPRPPRSSSAGKNSRREIGRADLPTTAEEYRPLNRMYEFSDVSRPGVGLKAVNCRSTEAGDRTLGSRL